MPLLSFPCVEDAKKDNADEIQATTLTAPFIEQFQSQIPQSRWTVSRATKQTPVGDETFSYVGTWAVEEPEVYPGIKGDTGLVLSEFYSVRTGSRVAIVVVASRIRGRGRVIMGLE